MMPIGGIPRVVSNREQRFLHFFREYVQCFKIFIYNTEYTLSFAFRAKKNKTSKLLTILNICFGLFSEYQYLEFDGLGRGPR